MTKGNVGPEIQGRMGRRTTPLSRFIGALPPILLLGWLLVLLGLPSGCGGGSGGPDASSGGQGVTPDTGGDGQGAMPNTGSGGESGSPTDCDDGKSCTLDVVVNARCTHSVGPNSGDTACPDGEYCTLKEGCTKAPTCATDADCKAVWKDDPCKTKVSCDGATATCTFEPLDKDGDGFAAVACGGGDCDDADANRYPGNTEACDGKDNNCDGTTDEHATCAGFAATCEAGSCVCPDENKCDNECVDMQTDAAHCGDCATKCDAGETCLAGVCGCSDPATCGEVIASTPHPFGIAVDNDFVYWGAGSTPKDGGVYRVGKMGGKVEPLVTGIAAVATLEVDDTDVYYVAGKDLQRVPKSGGKPATLAGLVSGDQIALSGADVYYGVDGGLKKVRKDGSAAETLVAPLDIVTGVAVDKVSFYWATVGINGGKTYVHSRPVAGGDDVEYYAGNANFGAAPGLLAVDSSNVYWMNLDDGTGKNGSLSWAPLDGSSGDRLAGGFRRAWGIAQDDDHIYWTGGKDCTIARIAKPGGSVDALATGVCQGRGIAVDADNVYWADDDSGAIRRIAK